MLRRASRHAGVLAALLGLVSGVAQGAGEPAPGAVTAQTLRLPDGPGSVRGLADSPSVNVFSAQVSYSIPLELPKGVAGFAPALALSYSGDLGNGELGIGWTLSMGSLRRSLRNGVPTYGAADELELVGIGGGGRLVQLTDGSWRVEGRGNEVKVVAQGSGYLVTVAGGTQYRLGTASSARLEEGTRRAAWYVEEAVHPNGQRVAFSYSRHNGQVYLSRVAWGPQYSVEVVYGPRTDTSVSWRTGFRVETAQRVARLVVNSFGEVLRSYELGYDNTFSLSRLARVRQQGRGGKEALPQLTFTYARPSTSEVVRVEASGGWVLNSAGVSLADVDGDGMNDLLRLDSAANSYRKGLGNRFDREVSIGTASTSALLNNTRLVDTDGDLRPELLGSSTYGWTVKKLGPKGWVDAGRWGGTENIALFDPNIAFADVNGDKRPDMVKGGDSFQVKWNEGKGLASTWTVKPAINGRALKPGPTVRLHEVNGDGLADVVELGTYSMLVHLGRGDGTFEAPRTYNNPWGSGVGDVRLCDLNRDGVMDVVRITSAQVSWYPGLAQGGFDSNARVVSGPGSSSYTPVIAIGDVNGNGSEDVVWSAADGMWALDIAGPTSAGMLVGLDNGMGKKLAFKYEGSGQLSVASEVAGKAWEKKLAFSIPVPVRMTVDVGGGAPQRVVKYEVRDGFWDEVERRFGGFLVGGVRTVGTSDADTLYEETRFHAGLGQDRALRGQPLEVRKEDGTGKVYSVASNSYEARAVEGLVAASPAQAALLKKSALLQTRTLNYEGSSTPIETLATFAYDARVRPVEARQLGRLDVQGDESVEQRLWGHDDETWVQDVTCEERVLSASQEVLQSGAALEVGTNATLVRRTRTYYGHGDADSSVLGWSDGWTPTRSTQAGCPVDRLVRKQLGWLQETTAGQETARWVTLSETKYDALDNPRDVYTEGVWRYLEYDTHGLYPVKETVSPATGSTLAWRTAWDYVLGQPSMVTDANGVEATVGYDALGRVVSMAAAGAPPHVRYSYKWDVDASNSTPKTWTLTYDGRHEAVEGSWTGSWHEGGRWRASVTVSNGVGEALYSAVRLGLNTWNVSNWQERDGRGRVSFVGNAFLASDLPTVRPAGLLAQTLAYDGMGRLVAQTLPTGATKAFTYGNFKSTVGTSGLAPVTSELDGLGRVLRTERVVNGNLESVSAAYDALGRVRHMCLNLPDKAACPSGTSAAGTAVTHSFSYDSLGRLVRAEDPDVGVRTLRYSDEGRLTHYTNGANQTRRYFYDNTGRLTRTVGEDKTGFTYHYDTAKEGIPSTNAQGRLAWVEEPRGEVHFGYDVFSRVTSLRRRVDSVWAEQRTTYSPSGLPLSMEVDGVMVNASYDAAGRAVRLGEYWEVLERDAAGNVLKEKYGNNVVETYTYDSLSLPKSIDIARHTGEQLYGVTLERNAWAAPVGVVDGDSTGLNHTATFTYDGAARLTEAVLASQEAQRPYRFTYQYDALQNLTQRTATGGTKAVQLWAGTYKHGLAGYGPRQLASIVTPEGTTHAFHYDKAGRVVAQAGNTLHYNDLDQLEQVEVAANGTTPAAAVHHAYGYDGLRTLTESPDGTQYWFAESLKQRKGKREWYLKAGDRTVARLTLAPAQTAGAAGMGGSGQLASSFHLGMRNGLGALLGVASMLVLCVATARTLRSRRLRPLYAGMATSAMLGAACGQGIQVSDVASATAALVEAGSTLYFHAGFGAGPVMMTREDGTVLEERRYEPFGAPIDAFSEKAVGVVEVGEVDHREVPLNSLNKETDATTGFSYHGARWMAPQSASWLTPDPLMKAPEAKFLSEPWQLHPYQYVSQNPIIYWDPDGREGIVLSGQPGGHGNPKHFLVNGLDRAVKMKEELKATEPGFFARLFGAEATPAQSVTWIIYDSGSLEKGGYPAAELQEAVKDAWAAGINVWIVKDQKEIVDYVNKKDGGTSRAEDPVSRFTYVGHALPGGIDPAYNHAPGKLNISALRPEAFSSDSIANLAAACNTAKRDGVVPSAAEQFAGKIGNKAIGSDKRTDYRGGVLSDKALLKTNGGKTVEFESTRDID